MQQPDRKEFNARLHGDYIEPSDGWPDSRWVLANIRAKLTRPSGRGRTVSVRCMIDSGALYWVLPESNWHVLQLRLERRAEFVFADGTTMTRGASECRFEIAEQAAISPVVLGKGDDDVLLGAVTLQTLVLMLDLLNCELIPMHFILARPLTRTARAS